MPFQTGIANSQADLVNIIETFCQSRGWSLAAGVLSKGASHIRLTNPTADKTQVEGANSADFAATPCPQNAMMWTPSGAFPCTYRLFEQTAPESVVCVINYNVSMHQWLAFGELQKYGGWTGGNWFAATHGTGVYGPGSIILNGPNAPTSFNSAYPSSGALFWNSTNQDGANEYSALRNGFVHAEIDGNIWPGAGVNNGTTDVAVWPKFAPFAWPIASNIPNAWNGQTPLVPYWIWLPRDDGKITPIGHLGGIRALRMENYNPADIITIGSDRWMAFPWWQKDLNNPSGGSTASGGASEVDSTGTFGFAVKYDGP